jgi:Leucine-rich repeat (LRR) protein
MNLSLLLCVFFSFTFMITVHCNEQDLSGRNLSRIDSSMFEKAPEDVQVLKLDHNRISEIEANTVWFNCFDCNLIELSLEGNLIETLNDYTFENLTKLNKLNFDNNKLVNISEKAFSGLADLTDLYLSGNKLQIIQRDTFNTLSNLKVLYLDSNQLLNLDNGLFSHMATLETLSLTSNNLTSISKEVFIPLINLETLHLGMNKIQHIDAQAFKFLFNLGQLNIEENNLTKSAYFSFISLNQSFNNNQGFSLNYCNQKIEFYDCKYDFKTLMEALSNETSSSNAKEKKKSINFLF